MEETTIAQVITLEQLADLSPNMRKALRAVDYAIPARDTYWITLQGLASRGLVVRPQVRSSAYKLTELGLAYSAALKQSLPK